MSKKVLILTEKPSAARNFAAALGGKSGIYNGEAYTIVNSVGHVYEYKDPSDMVPEDKKKQYADWKIDNLPWNLEDIRWSRKKKAKVSDILSNIQKGAEDTDEIAIATDSDPSGEGELLAWEIISGLKLKKPLYTRIDFEDEAPASIQKAFVSRRILGTDLSCMYDDPDFKQAQFRSQWDLLSMQFTRIATAYGTKSSGRFMVPRQGRLKSVMVRITGDQLKKVADYVETPYFQNRFRDENGVIYSSKKEKTYPAAEEVPQIYTDSPVAMDEKNTSRKHSIPPKFLDLASLSARLASRGYRAKDVLSTYQKMYEAHIVSYPRTDDKVITPEQFSELKANAAAIAAAVGVDPSILTHTRIRSTHVKAGGAHGANRPGSAVPSSLAQIEKSYGKLGAAIYRMLALNSLAVLAEDYVYDHQAGYVVKYPEFTGFSNVPVSLGWKALYSCEEIKDEEGKEESSKGIGTHAEPFVYRGTNPRPEAPTMKWLMKQLEKNDVGTGATRTSIFSDVTSETAKFPLMKMSRRGTLSMTDIGDASYQLLQDTIIGDVKTTEHLQKEMREVKAGTLDAEECLAEVAEMVVKDRDTMAKNAETLKLDPKNAPAGSARRKTDGPAELYTGRYQDKDVSFKREFGGHRFSDEECEALLRGETVTVSMKSRYGKPVMAECELGQQSFKRRKWFGIGVKSFLKDGNSDRETSSDAPSDTVYTGMFNGSQVSFKREFGGHHFTDEECEALLTGETLTLDLKSRTGKNFTADCALGDQSFNGRSWFGIGIKAFAKKKETKKRAASTRKKTAPADPAERYTGSWNGKEVSFKRDFSGHHFSDAECEALLKGEVLTLKLRSRTGKEFTADCALGDQTFNGRKWFGIGIRSFTK